MRGVWLRRLFDVVIRVILSYRQRLANRALLPHQDDRPNDSPSSSHVPIVIYRIFVAAVLAAFMAAMSSGVASTAATVGSVMPPVATLSPDQRAAALVQKMTLAEKLSLLHGVMPSYDKAGKVVPPGAVFAAGYVAGVPRLGIPALTETDATLGVAWIMGLRHDGATPLPSGLAIAATFDPERAYRAGAMVGREARSKGFNVLLGGGANLARDPRGGRNFEYLGEDPLLTGVMAGAEIRGAQDQHIVSTIKHFALNDQETGRNVLNARIGEAAARESDLLAFEIAIEQGHPGAVMCGYNRVNGAYDCENEVLLNQVLKADWRYPGWVMSDWGAVHTLKAALAGLDQQSSAQLDPAVFFALPLADAAARDRAYRLRLDDMVRRILRSLCAAGVLDQPGIPGVIDEAGDTAVARDVASAGIVLLKNRGNLLPLAKKPQRIAIIGGHADIGVMSGGGSSQVMSPSGPALVELLGAEHPEREFMRRAMYHPSSPYRAILKKVPGLELAYDNGIYPKSAADLARRADIAIVFATKWMQEGDDAPDLTLPEGQDATIAAVAAANPRTIVVLETGGPVLMPWLSKTAAVLEAWYPGGAGGLAIADILFGDANPSGHLPMSFPRSETQLPRPEIPGWRLPKAQAFDVSYTEGADVGYRWYARRRLRPLFPFGAGLSYTHFSFDRLKLSGGSAVSVRFRVKNVGVRAGVATPQLYLVGGARHGRERLAGWASVPLSPGASREVEIAVDRRLLADWDEAAHAWRIRGGAYGFAVGQAANDAALAGRVRVDAAILKY